MPTAIHPPAHPPFFYSPAPCRTVLLSPAARARRCAAATLLLMLPSLASLRADVPADGNGSNGEVITLPQFSITSEKDTSYTGTQALSTTRSGVDLADLSQSVTVLNQAFFNDYKPAILSHALNYIGGAQTGTINWSVDRFMIRGFVGEGDYVDGFRTQTDRNTDINFIDHIEVIKGPAAIFIANANNTVGGVVNKVSKSPTDYYEASATVQFGAWDSNRASIDVGGPLTPDKKLTGRVLVNRQQAKGYYDHTYDNRTAIMPMLAYKFSDSSQVWIKYENFDSHYSSYNGVPLDGRNYNTIGRPTAPTIAAIPRYWNIDGEDSPRNWRTDYFYRLWGQFSTRPVDWLAIRFAGFDSADTQRRVESILGTVNIPQTVTVNGTPTVVSVPGYQIASTFVTQNGTTTLLPGGYTPGKQLARTTTAVNGDYQPRRELQNDYVFTFDTWVASHTLLLGTDLLDFPEDTKTYSSGSTSTAFSSAIDPFNPPYISGAPDVVSVNFNQPPTTFNHIQQNFAKVYGLETVSFLKDRVIADWGFTRSRYDSSRNQDNFNETTGVFTPASVTGGTLFTDTVAYNNLVQYGFVVKPLPNVSVFYGNTRNFVFNGFGTLSNGAQGLLPPSFGHQQEVGLKTTWLKKRLSVNVSYFDALQFNNTVPAFPQTNPPTFLTVGGENSRGFDGDWSYAVTNELYLLGSFAYFNAHIGLAAPWNLIQQPFDGLQHSSIPVDNVSEHNAALWARYQFNDGFLKGLSVGLGANYQAKRAITDNSNNVFFGYVPGRTLLDTSISYTMKHFVFQVNIDNLLNRHYIYSARSELVIIPGEPLTASASVTYKFF
jgi:iron complex outermembrane receptor protein